MDSVRLDDCACRDERRRGRRHCERVAGARQRDRIRRDGQHDRRRVHGHARRVHHATEVRMGVHILALGGFRSRTYRQRFGLRGSL